MNDKCGYTEQILPHSKSQDRPRRHQESRVVEGASCWAPMWRNLPPGGSQECRYDKIKGDSDETPAFLTALADIYSCTISDTVILFRLHPN